MIDVSLLTHFTPCLTVLVLDVDVFGCVCFWLDFKRPVKDMLPFKFVCNSIVHFRYTKNVIEEFLATSSGCMCWFIENFNPKLKFCASMLKLLVVLVGN